MGSSGKSFALTLVLIMAISSLSLMIIKPAFAQTFTPSVPQFTVQLVGPPAIVNTTYSLDQNTGKIVAQIGNMRKQKPINSNQ